MLVTSPRPHFHCRRSLASSASSLSWSCALPLPSECLQPESGVALQTGIGVIPTVRLYSPAAPPKPSTKTEYVVPPDTRKLRREPRPVRPHGASLLHVSSGPPT